ncbi:MAG: hypothetical protein Q8L07_05160 [Sediminibacterium sp.]|nr:hypothetical protein [Sediminibacterium sp.]MDP1810361.1 hypothetical protein [Sediminibacterium sp.]MDP3128533.1 hypothetical protein [Sediminibacterium sp.]
MYSNYGGDSRKGFFHIGHLLHPIICVRIYFNTLFQTKIAYLQLVNKW